MMAVSSQNSIKTGAPVTQQSQQSHKRWYPTLPPETHQDIINAHKFAWDNMYQMRGWVRQLANAGGVALEGDTAAGSPVAKSGAVSPNSGQLSLSSNATGPSNSQIMGLNIKATPPSNGQFPAYNSTTGQIEFTSPVDLTNYTKWTTTIPASHTDAGTVGTIAFDPTGANDHWYICVKTGTAGLALWGRIGSVDYTF